MVPAPFPRPVALFAILVPALSWLVVPSAARAGEASDEIHWGFMGIGLVGGLAVFLFGMDLMSDAMRKLTGDRLKEILARLTANPLAGVVTGAITTAIVQSSSVTTVIAVGFISAGLMNLNQVMGVIFGANIGSTVTAQIVAFKVTEYALLMVAVGFGMWMLGKGDRVKQWGLMLIGFGLVFHGMGQMSLAMQPLRSYHPFLELMQSMENPALAILVAALFTGVIQSSAATTSIVIVMAGQGLVTLPAGIALTLGANIGTTITAMLACIGKSREAVRAAVAHLGFNVIGVIIWTPFIPQLSEAVTWLSPAAHAALTGMEKIAAETPRQIANAHTVFNVVNTLIFLPFTVPYARLVRFLIRERPLPPGEAPFQAKYLDEAMLTMPALALSMVRREVRRMGWVVEQMLQGIPEGVFKGRLDHMDRIRDMDNHVDILYGEICRYIAEIDRRQLSEKESREALTAMNTVAELEHIGDIVETNMHHLAAVVAINHITAEPEGVERLSAFHASLLKAYRYGVVAFEQDREDAARAALAMEGEINEAIEKHLAHRHNQLLDTTDRRMHQALTLESDILENFKRIYFHIRRIAKRVLVEGTSSTLEGVP